MGTVNLKDARNLVATCTEFKGSSIFAKNEGRWYVVYSYGIHFPMFAYHRDQQQWYANSDKYSVTTSRHQTACRPHGMPLIQVDTATLKQKIGG